LVVGGRVALGWVVAGEKGEVRAVGGWVVLVAGLEVVTVKVVEVKVVVGMAVVG
jgi:hypothetical protein